MGADTPKIKMHAIRVAAAKLAFRRNMEFWGRDEVVPAKYQRVGPYIKRKDPAARDAAVSQFMEEAKNE